MRQNKKGEIPSSFFCRAHFYMRHHQIGGKESRPTGILPNMFSYMPKQKKGNPVIIFFVGRISICAIIKSAGKNPALREFCQTCFHTR